MAGRDRAPEWEMLDRFSTSTPVGRPDPAANPFRAKPEVGRGFRPITAEDRLKLSEAPRKPGTRVITRGYDVFRKGQPDNWSFWPDHMYREFDDGRQQFIYRAGPSKGRLHVQVTPAQDSPDYESGTRVLDVVDMPGLAARDAIQPALQTARRLEGSPYLGLASNSNFAVAEQSEDQLGYRIGDRQTPGWEDFPVYDPRFRGPPY